MKCPYCGHTEQKVLDSRPARDNGAIRRRRECNSCQRRFTSFEEPEKPRLIVVKRDGTRQPFDPNKLLISMSLACGKRPVSTESLEEAVQKIEHDLLDTLELEVSTTEIGERVTDELYKLDAVAYIRYSSVYRAFERPQEFADIVRKLQNDSRKAKKKTPTAATIQPESE